MAQNSEKKKRRGSGRPFKPGQSGNPGGRPKGLAEFRLRARRYSNEALRRLLGVMRGRKADPLASARVRAIRELFDRAWGRPVQELDVHGFMARTDIPAAELDLSTDQKQSIARRLAFMLAEGAHAAPKKREEARG